MNLSELFEMQKKLDAHIVQEKGLEDQDLFPQQILSLQVELGELANEWRGFKYWSTDQNPRYERKCHACDGAGGFMGGSFEESEMCLYCEGSGIEARPLLEEYVDCLHFFLSIAVQKEWLEHLYLYEEAIEETREQGLDGGVCGAILEVIYWLSKLHMEKKEMPNIKERLGYSTEVFYFRNAWFVFIAVGMIGFDWTWEQITAAYVAKNEVNHERQDNGY